MVKTVSPRKVARAIASKRNPVAVAFGANLKRLRIDRDKSQIELAFECELDRTYVSLMERGLANPSLLTLSTLCYCLKLSLAELVSRISATMPPSSVAKGGIKGRTNQASHEPKANPTRRSPLR